jgi:hypothetical protein
MRWEIEELLRMADIAMNFIDKYRDTVDGDYGAAVPNEACEIYTGLQIAIEEAEKMLAKAEGRT